MSADMSNFLALVMEKLDEGHRAQLNWLWQQASEEIASVRQDRDNLKEQAEHLKQQAEHFRQQAEHLRLQAYEEFDKVARDHNAEVQTYKMQLEQFQAENERLNQIQKQYMSQPQSNVTDNQRFEQKFAAVTADRDATNKRVKEVEAQCREYLKQKNSISINLGNEIATLRKTNEAIQQTNNSLKAKYADLKEELGQEQRASGKSNERIKKKDAEISELKELVVRQASSSHGGQRSSSLPTNVTDNTVPSPTTTLRNPRKRTRTSTPDLRSNEDVSITPAQKTFLLDTTKIVRDLVFSKFLQSQKFQTTVCDEEEAEGDDSTRGKGAPGFDTILSKLQKDQYVSIDGLEADFKKMTDHAVVSGSGVAEEKRALELFYAWKTKISRLPAPN